MKNITKSLIALFAVLAISCSSDDVEHRPVIIAGDAPVMSAPEGANSYVLAVEQASNQAERFVWTSANFRQDVAINYEVQLGLVGNNFKNSRSLGSVIGANQLSVSVETLNSSVLALGGLPFEVGQFEVRIKASVNNAFEALYSNVATISITPYTTETPKLWMPGGYQLASGYGENFAHTTAAQLKSLAYGNTKFEGYVYIANDITSTDNGFKFSTQENWDGTNYGAGATPTTVSPTGANITATAGYYRVKVDTNPEALSLNMTQTTWGIIGNSTPGGWENSTPMTYDPATKKWWIVVALTAQSAPDNGWKFRANNSWDINLGDAVLNATDGILSEGGSNIGIATAGTYRIELDLSNPRDYKYTIVRQ